MENKNGIEYIKQRICSLESELNAYRQALNLILPYEEKEVLLFPQGSLSSNTILHKSTDFDQLFPQKKKSQADVVFELLKSEGRFLHVKEITLYLRIHYKWDEDFKASQKKASQSIDSLKRNDLVVRYTVGNNFTYSFWGLPEWLDQNGQIKEGHTFDERFLDKEPVKNEIVVTDDLVDDDVLPKPKLIPEFDF